MQDLGVDCGGLLWGERETPARQIHLIVRWNAWELVRAKMGDDSHFVVVYPVIWVGGREICWSLLLGQVFLNI